jgi:phosphoribosylformimino-5-aminoimidazole carboxamide ribotide isomerase
MLRCGKHTRSWRRAGLNDIIATFEERAIEVIPAIDIRGGRCVRLYQGDFSRETVYGEDPLETALQWQSQGATRLHIVDLDGAEAGSPQNVEIIARIAETVFIPLEVGGGIRTVSAMEQLLKSGADRVVLGTAAVSDPGMVREACRQFGQSIVVSIDARNGLVTTHGWMRETGIHAVEFARRVISLGVRRFIYTDINRDGTLTEPNFLGVFELIDAIKFPVIASGGVSGISHLKFLKKIGAEGAIVGKALYTGDLDLSRALQTVAD